MTEQIPSDAPVRPETAAESFSFPLLERAKSGGFLYRVFRTRSDFVDVTAYTAADALSISEVEHAIKIEHLHARMPDILDIGALGGLSVKPTEGDV